MQLKNLIVSETSLLSLLFLSSFWIQDGRQLGKRDEIQALGKLKAVSTGSEDRF